MLLNLEKGEKFKGEETKGGRGGIIWFLQLEREREREKDTKGKVNATMIFQCFHSNPLYQQQMIIFTPRKLTTPGQFSVID